MCAHTNTLLKHLRPYYSTVFLGRLLYCTFWFGNICPLFFAKMLQICQIGRVSLVYRDQILRSSHRFSMEFSYGLWLGHSKTLILFLWSLPFVDLDVCFGVFVTLKDKFSLNLQLSIGWRFCNQIDDWYLEWLTIISTLTFVPAEEK